MVFFSHSPPYMLRNALGNVFVAGTIFAVLTYVTLYQNQTIGVMLILAFLITMTQVTEHLTGDGRPPAQQGSTPPAQQGSPSPAPTNIPPPPAPPASSTSTMPQTGTTMDSSGNIVDGSGRIVQRSGTGVTATATTTPPPAQATSTPVAPATTSAPTAPATPPPAAAAPAPVMSCNIESFAPF